MEWGGLKCSADGSRFVWEEVKVKGNANRNEHVNVNVNVNVKVKVKGSNGVAEERKEVV